jgi:hypothetical protein
VAREVCEQDSTRRNFPKRFHYLCADPVSGGLSQRIGSEPAVTDLVARLAERFRHGPDIGRHDVIQGLEGGVIAGRHTDKKRESISQVRPPFVLL